MRACKIMNAVARRDQVESVERVQVVRCSDNEADAVRQSCCRCSASSLLDRLLVGIESRNLSLREIFGDSYADAARTAADVENASTLLQPGNYARHCLEPIT